MSSSAPETETLEYIKNALKTLKEGIPDEEKDIFIQNVLEQTSGHELELSCQNSSSHCLELLLDEIHDLDVVIRFMDAFSKDFQSACGNCFASHITETILYYGLKNMQTWSTDIEDNNEKDEDKAEKIISVISWIQSLGEFCLENLQTCLEDNYGCHVLRAVIQTLGGYYLCETINKNKRIQEKKRHYQEEYLGSENLLKLKKNIELDSIPKCFIKILKKISKYFLKLENLKVYAVHPETAPVIQILLYVLKKRSPKRCKKIINILLLSLFDNVVEEKIPEALTHKNCSFVVEKVFEFSSDEQQNEIWKTYIEPFLNLIILDPVANFVLQRMFNIVESKTQFEIMCSSVLPLFNLIYESKHFGILVAIASACNRLKYQQAQFMIHLIKCLNCPETEESQVSLAPLLLNFQKYDTFDKNFLLKNYNSVSLQGSLLIQAILNFQKPYKIVNSLLSMKSENLLFLACHIQGCHILTSFLSSATVGEKNKDRFIQTIKPILTTLACDRSGNLTLSRMWTLLTLKQKSTVAEELSQNNTILQKDSNGFGISKKFGLYYYKHKRDKWKSFQINLSKKRTISQIS